MILIDTSDFSQSSPYRIWIDFYINLMIKKFVPTNESTVQIGGFTINKCYIDSDDRDAFTDQFIIEDDDDQKLEILRFYSGSKPRFTVKATSKEFAETVLTMLTIVL